MNLDIRNGSLNVETDEPFTLTEAERILTGMKTFGIPESAIIVHWSANLSYSPGGRSSISINWRIQDE